MNKTKKIAESSIAKFALDVTLLNIDNIGIITYVSITGAINKTPIVDNTGLSFILVGTGFGSTPSAKSSNRSR